MTTTPIDKLYSRLKDLGFTRAAIRTSLLPEWWEDSLSFNPANLAIAEVGLSRLLGLDIASLRDHTKALSFGSPQNVRLKRAKGTPAEKLRPAIQLARQSASQIIPLLERIEPFRGHSTALEVRRQILQRARYVDFESLLSHVWSQGIVVLHMERLPASLPKFAGIATFVGETPVIVLAHNRDAPAWLAFHLGHELGHILLGHVQRDGEVIADADLEAESNDAQEREADRFAMDLLAGEGAPRPPTQGGLTAQSLAAVARFEGERLQIDPGTLCLMHAKHFERYPVAVSALKLLGRDTGAKAAIGRELGSHLTVNERSDTAELALAMMAFN